MFFGIDRLNQRCNQLMNEKYTYISDNLSKDLSSLQADFLKQEKGKRLISKKFQYSHLKSKVYSSFESTFYPFDGHVSKLGHLYRHLYHIIKFVARAEILDWQQKYDYLKMLRGQLSNHEQAIMFFNIIWIDDDNEHNWWVDKKGKNEQSYLLDYAILKNLPFNLTKQLGPDPISYFTEKMKKHKRCKGKQLKQKDIIGEKLEEKLNWYSSGINNKTALYIDARLIIFT